MSLEIFYTPRSKETLRSTYDFISGKFGFIVADKFIAKTEKVISLIAENPFMYKATTIDPSVRKALISKQTSLFYQVKDKSIDLLFFWDNRQEPFFQ